MPAIGVSSTFQALISAPTGTVIQEVEQSLSKEVKTIRNASGVTVQASTLPIITTKVSVKGKGIPALSTVAATASVTSGTLVTTSVSVDESNDDYPGFTIEAESYA